MRSEFAGKIFKKRRQSANIEMKVSSSSKNSAENLTGLFSFETYFKLIYTLKKLFA
jgi:hypothetical protein